jgi:Trypsin-co-occurring domain 2
MGSGQPDRQRDPAGTGQPDVQSDPTASTRVVNGEQQPTLSRMLQELTEQLRATMVDEQAAGVKPLLKVKACTVELAITWTIEGDGDVKFWVLDLTGKASRENAQTITVTLAPIGTIDTLTGAPQE